MTQSPIVSSAHTASLSALNPADISAAAGLLREGQLVALPTETVYGLAANATDPAAVAAIYAAKGRPADNPLIVHIASLTDLESVVREVPEAAKRLAEAFWPGPLSMVLPRQPHIPDSVTAGLDTVAVRVPNHPGFLAVLSEAGVPLAAPSANRAGSPSPTTAGHVAHDLSGHIAAILNGGPCTVGVESTVIDLTKSPPRLLRPGGINLEQLENVLGEVDVDPAVSGFLTPDQVPGSPGMKYRHYAPAAPMVVLTGPLELAVKYVKDAQASVPLGHSMPLDYAPAATAVLCPTEEADSFKAVQVETITYGSLSDPATLARGVFDALRAVDRPDVTQIFARIPLTDDGVNRATRNRLLKAAAFQVVQLDTN